MAAQLPQELIIEILLRSPVKSLLRFRCLSKTLSSVIDGVDFINSHLTKSSQNFNRLIFQGEPTKLFHIFDVNVDLEEEEDILRIEKPASSPWYEIYGYCKGLFLLTRTPRQTGFGLTLWNPSTRRYRDLPDCPVQSIADNDRLLIIGSGLGYDESTDDYRAYFIVLVQDELDDFEMQVWIYGLRWNIWRRFQQDFPVLGFGVSRLPGFDGFGYFADGIIYWLILKPIAGWPIEVVAFDVRQETFSLVPQPPEPACSINSGDGVSKKLHLLEGSLCISYYFANSNALQADLYMRTKKDGTDEFTWTQLYSVKEPLFDKTWKLVKVLGYSKSKDKILFDNHMDYLISYDIKEKRFAKVEVGKDPSWNDPFLFVESLVPLGDGA